MPRSRGTRVGMVALAMIVGAASVAVAGGRSRTGPVHPPQSYECYHMLWSCSFVDSDGWWSGCDPELLNDRVVEWYRAEVFCQEYLPK